MPNEELRSESGRRPFFARTWNLELRTSLIGLYAVLAVLVFPVFPHFVSPNELSRWALAAAIVEDHSLEISRYVQLLGGGRFEDVAERDGHLYSNKAPGAALIGLPGYAIARLIVGPPSPSNIRATLTAMRLVAATLPLLALAWMFARTAHRLRSPPDRTRVAITILLFATPLFAYGLLNFSHALTAFALFGAWTLLFVDPSPRRDVVAGALIGLAVISEYTTAIVCAVLILVAWRRAHRIIVGGLPFALLLAAYNYAAFGSVFSLSTASERYAPLRKLVGTGLFGIGVPDIGGALRQLFDPARGLFVFSPVLLVALIGIWRMRRVLTSGAWITLILAPLSLLILFSGYPNWHGGWNVGPRYIVPVVPFVAMGLAFVGASWIESLLAGASIVAVALTSLTFPFPDVSFAIPWQTLGVPLLRDGLVAPNALHLVARPLAIAVPFALVFIAALGLQKRWFVLGGAVLMLALSAVLIQMQPPSLTQRLRVGYVEEVYFERRGAMQRALPPGAPIPPPAIARAKSESALPPSSWPF